MKGIRIFFLKWVCVCFVLGCLGISYANVAEIDVVLEPMTLQYYPLEVESGETSVTIEITRGSGDIDLYVRKGQPATGSTSNEIAANADFASESPSWQESVTIDQSTNPAIAPGTWYVSLVNLNDYTVSATVRATSQTAASSSSTGSSAGAASNPGFAPQSGLWYNESKPGHGIDIELYDGNLAAVWYTYNQDQTPTWYLAIGPYSGSSTWTATLNKYHWNGSSASATPVGSITLEFKNRTRATFRWTLNGQSGSEPIERFTMADTVPPVNLTGLWYNSSEPGYGYSIDTQGNVLAVVAYFYDAQGEPRWALNSSTVQDVHSKATVPALVFFGPCPNCQDTGFRSVQAGTITRGFTDSTHGTIGVDISLPAPMNSSWTKAEAPVVLLSDAVDNTALELEGVVDEVIAVFSDSTDMVGGFTDSFSSLGIEDIDASTCPRISYGDLSNLSLSGPMSIPVRIDFGSGCMDAQGNSWTGYIDLPLNVTLGSAVHLDTQFTVQNLTKNGQLLANGSGSVNLDLSASSSDLASGTGSISLNLEITDNQPLSGRIDLRLTNIDLEPLYSEDDDSSVSVSDLVDALGSSGRIDITFNNFVVGQDTTSGTVTVRALSRGSGRIDLNLQTTQGPVQGSFTVRKGSSPSDVLVSTSGPATVLGYQVIMDNVEINPDRCANAPVSGSMTVIKGANRGRFTFDGSCLGYVYQAL